MGFEEINDEGYQYIGELTQEISRLEMKLSKNESMKWRMLQSNKIMDGRQKMFDEVEIMSDSSVDSCRYREILKTDDC